MDLTTRLDRFQRRHHWAAFPLAVAYKFYDDYGGYLAALIAYYAFVSLFPLLLLLSTVLGFFLANDPGLQRQVLDSALSQFPVVGQQLSDPRHIGGGALGLVIGILGSLYGGLGAAQALQYAMNTAWSVPRNERPNPFQARVRSLLMVATGGLVLLATTALSALGGGGGGSLGILLRVVVLAASVVLNAAAFVLMFRSPPPGTSRAARWPGRDLRRTGLAAAAGLRRRLRRPRGEERQRRQRGLRDRAGTDRLPLCDRDRRSGVCRGERRTRRPPSSAGSHDAVHRQRQSHARGSPCLLRPSRSSTHEGLPGRRRDLRPTSGPLRGLIGRSRLGEWHRCSDGPPWSSPLAGRSLCPEKSWCGPPAQTARQTARLQRR